MKYTYLENEERVPKATLWERIQLALTDAVYVDDRRGDRLGLLVKRVGDKAFIVGEVFERTLTIVDSQP